MTGIFPLCVCVFFTTYTLLFVRGFVPSTDLYLLYLVTRNVPYIGLCLLRSFCSSRMDKLRIDFEICLTLFRYLVSVVTLIGELRLRIAFRMIYDMLPVLYATYQATVRNLSVTKQIQ